MRDWAFRSGGFNPFPPSSHIPELRRTAGQDRFGLNPGLKPWAILFGHFMAGYTPTSQFTRWLSYTVRRRNPSSPRSKTLRYIGDAGFDVSGSTGVPRHRSQAKALDVLKSGYLSSGVDVISSSLPFKTNQPQPLPKTLVEVSDSFLLKLVETQKRFCRWRLLVVPWVYRLRSF